MEEITRFKTVTNRIFKTEQQAEKHEQEIIDKIRFNLDNKITCIIRDNNITLRRKDQILLIEKLINNIDDITNLKEYLNGFFSEVETIEGV